MQRSRFPPLMAVLLSSRCISIPSPAKDFLPSPGVRRHFLLFVRTKSSVFRLSVQPRLEVHTLCLNYKMSHFSWTFLMCSNEFVLQIVILVGHPI